MYFNSCESQDSEWKFSYKGNFRKKPLRITHTHFIRDPSESGRCGARGAPTWHALVCHLPYAHTGWISDKFPQRPSAGGKWLEWELGSAAALGVTMLFAHPRCYRPGVSAWRRLAALTLPQGGIDDEKKIYGLPKDHKVKVDIPLRPIVSSIDFVLRNAEIFLKPLRALAIPNSKLTLWWSKHNSSNPWGHWST
jgi:hypothetical protein